MIFDELLVPREALPAERHKAQIMDKIESNRVVLIMGATGCGKSTQVPKMLQQHLKKRVLCVQPRRMAVVAVATRVAEELDVTLGEKEVGYHIGAAKLAELERAAEQAERINAEKREAAEHEARVAEAKERGRKRAIEKMMVKEAELKAYEEELEEAKRVKAEWQKHLDKRSHQKLYGQDVTPLPPKPEALLKLETKERVERERKAERRRAEEAPHE